MSHVKIVMIKNVSLYSGTVLQKPYMESLYCQTHH